MELQKLVRAANVQAGVLTVVLVLVGWMPDLQDGWLITRCGQPAIWPRIADNT
jgi:hypothetical protein